VNLVADSPQQSWREFATLPVEAGAVFIVLDNYDDPVAEAKEAAEVLGPSLRGLLLDTDSSRRGDIKTIVSEVAWNLRLMNRSDVRICLTGGVTSQVIEHTKQYVESYGVGLSALQGPMFDFALQVVAVEGKARAKLGVQSGKKTTFVCNRCGRRTVDLFGIEILCCDAPMTSLIEKPVPERIHDLRAIRKSIRDS
jgi:nicotinate phosphoribosyltransferase